jgi:hypothetical protein
MLKKIEVLFLLLFFVRFAFCKLSSLLLDLLSKEGSDDNKNISVLKELKQMLTFKPYVLLFTSSMLGILSIQV